LKPILQPQALFGIRDNAQKLRADGSVFVGVNEFEVRQDIVQRWCVGIGVIAAAVMKNYVFQIGVGGQAEIFALVEALKAGALWRPTGSRLADQMTRFA